MVANGIGRLRAKEQSDGECWEIQCNAKCFEDYDAGVSSVRVMSSIKLASLPVKVTKINRNPTGTMRTTLQMQEKRADTRDYGVSALFFFGELFVD